MKWKIMRVMQAVVLAVTVIFVSATVYAADAKAGKAVYEKNKCAMCHGKDGKGTKMGSALAGKKVKKNAILKGVKPKMPAYEKKISGGDVDSLVKFIESLK